MLKRIAKGLAYSLGFEITRARPRSKSGDRPSVWDPYHEQARLLKRVANPVIFDVGAHIGQTAVKYNKLFPAARIYSFEPFKASFEMLQVNVKSRPEITPVNLALGALNGKRKLTINRSTATNSLFPTDHRAQETWNGTDVTNTVGEMEVSISTLDTYIQSIPGLNKIDILKLDAQGSEMEILIGARSLMEKGMIGIVFTEIIVMPTYVGQRNLDEYLAYMRTLNYYLHNFYNCCYSNEGQINQLDALFIYEGPSHS